MAKTRQLRKRIKAVANIKRITKTMQMIATAKFSASQQRATASKPYTEALFQLVAEMAGSIGEASHPLLKSPAGKSGGGAGAGTSGGGKELTLIITSDRGLCGPYNGSILRTAMGFLRANAGAKAGEIELVGKKGAGFLKYNSIPVAKQHTFGDKPGYDAVQRLADEYIARFSAGEISVVRVIYMKFVSAGKQTPAVLQLLPFDASAIQIAKKGQAASSADEKTKTQAAQYEFSPTAAELLGDLLPAAVRAVLFQCLTDAVVSEHVARMVAMKAATDNAGKAGKRLTRVFNRARQAQITTELTEIISGAAALS
ncbi:MAG: ATP synthase F1 subunit gamma [Planctomycetota bacterium]|nr:ATP synthase F1 subunit gamma [Planctomycetota bacterium]